MKLLLSGIFAFMISISLSAQNPVSPPDIYIADRAAKVWNDVKLYIYCSLDESCDDYCSHRHQLLVTDDMKNWSLTEDIFRSSGEGDHVPNNNKVLYARDASFNERKYDTYFRQPDRLI